jgi:hypothetical protein
LFIFFQNIYPSFLRTSPPFSLEFEVFLALLNSLSYGQAAIVHVRGDTNGVEFVSMFEENRARFKIHVSRKEMSHFSLDSDTKVSRGRSGHSQ